MKSRTTGRTFTAMALSLSLSGCTQLHIGGDLVVMTSAGDGCQATRGLESDAQGAGQAQAAIVAQEGAGAATGALSRLFVSRVGCPAEPGTGAPQEPEAAPGG